MPDARAGNTQDGHTLVEELQQRRTSKDSENENRRPADPDSKGDALGLYGVSGIPNVILIAPDGKIIATDIEGKELKAKLEEIFGDN